MRVITNRPASRFSRLVPSLLACLLSCLGLASSLFAQRYHTRIYDYSSGIPTVDIAGITQDASGDLWIASRAGLIQYDGLDWRLHLAFRGRGESIEHCCSDPTGRLWTASQGLVAWFADGTWHDLPRPFDPSQIHMLDMASLDIGGTSHLLILSGRGQGALWNGKSWTRVQLDRETQPTILACAASQPTGEFWLATPDALYRMDPRTGIAARLLDFERGSPAYGIGFDASESALWLMGATWAGRLDLRPVDSKPPRIRILHEDLGQEVAVKLHPHFEVQGDGRGGVWFGNAFTILHLTGGRTLKKISTSNGLAAEGLSSLFMDREQNIWITSARGLTKVISERFAGYDREQGLLEDEVTAICELEDGAMVLGHSGGLTILDPTGSETIHIKGGSPKSRVMDLSLGPDGILWIACDFVGIGRLHRRIEGRDGASRIDWLPNLPNRRFFSICHDRNGVAWTGSADGLYKIDGEELIRFPLPNPQLSANYGVRRVVLGTGDSLLLATMTSGIIGLTKERTISPWETGAVSRNTYTVIQDSKGRIWGGSHAGLLVLEAGRFRFSRTPRIQRPVYAVLEDSDHRLWVGTDKGVYCWDGEELHHYDANKGLIGAEVNRAALFEDSRKRIWIGTDRGVSCYEPKLDTRVVCAPLLRFRKVEVSGTLHDISTPMTLSADLDDLTFRFSASSFIDEKGVKFQTRLENFDEGWSAWQKLPTHEIRYTNLPAGMYRFHLRAMDVEGNRSQEIVSSTLRIKSPFYAQAWFVTCSGLLLLGMAWVGFLFLSQRRYAHELETQIHLHTDRLQKAERTQAQLARLESLGALAGGIAHDFNNLLTAITGYNSLVAETSNLDDESSEFVEEIQKACARAQTLTRQLLTFSSGGTPVREITSIQEVICDACGFALMGSTLECNLDLPEDLPAVKVDAGQFHQVFNNLILNARQAMPDGGVLRISARALPDEAADGMQIQIDVTDEGQGIPEKVLDQIFDPYFTTKEEGSGLGLAIVHSIVTKHGGTVIAENNVPSGATFRITIPAVPDQPRSTSPSPERSTLDPCRILIMDDQLAIRSFVRSALEHHGCEVTEADDGVAAIAAYKAGLEDERPYCAMIMDLTIPGGMGGLEAAQAILAIDPRAQLIVTSGYANEPILADYRSSGFVGRLSKPFSTKDLIRVLCQIQKNTGSRMSAD